MLFLFFRQNILAPSHHLFYFLAKSLLKGLVHCLSHDCHFDIDHDISTAHCRSSLLFKNIFIYLKWLLVTQNFTFVYVGRFLYWWWGNRQTWLCNKGNVNLVGQFCKDNREPWQWRRRQQQEREKSNGFVKQNNNFAHASPFFVHFFAITAWLPHETV